MKLIKLFTVLSIVLFSQLLNGQSKINEKRAMKESHIDFTKEYVFFTIHGLIEIDGHAFKNDTCKCPIQFKADLNGIEIINSCTGLKYQHRICDKNGCKIIHLEKLNDINHFEFYPNWRNFINVNDSSNFYKLAR